MSDLAKDYVLADAAPSAELKRLREIDSYMRSTTEARITRLGIAPGWQCLEVGAGAGGVAHWMAEKVGKTGSVTATDISPKVDLDPHLPWLEVRRHNILESGLEDGLYDLVHCRLLLIHVSPVEIALQNMVRALRPGGWLIIEEPGDLKISEVGEDDPRVAEYNRLHEEFLASISMIALNVDLTLFRRLPGLIHDLGLSSLGGDQTQMLVRAAGRAAMMSSVRAFSGSLRYTPFASQGRMDRFIEPGCDGGLVTFGGATLAVWGQRPA